MSQRFESGIGVRVYTRPMQWVVPVAMLGCGFVFFALASLTTPPRILVAVAGALAWLIVLPLAAHRLFPTRDVATLTPDGLQFARRGQVPFAQIREWQFEDYLKLKRPGRLTLLVIPADRPERAWLQRAFPQALAAWQARQPEGAAPILHTRFYGSALARGCGLAIMLASAALAWMLPGGADFRYYQYGLLASGLAVGAVLLLGGRPQAA